MLGIAVERRQTDVASGWWPERTAELHVKSRDFTNARSIAAAHRQLRPVAQKYKHTAAESAMHLGDAFDVHDRGAMNAQEAAGVEPFFDIADRLAHKKRRVPRVQPHVLSLCADPFDVVDG